MQKLSEKGGIIVQMRSVLLSLGVGLAAGVTAAAILPKNPQFKKAVRKAASSIEGAVEDAKDFVCGE